MSVKYTGFLMFCKSKPAVVEPDPGRGAWLRGAAALWNAMSPAERAPYETKAATANQRGADRTKVKRAAK